MEQREKLIDILSRFRECMYDETVDCNECDYKDVGECCDTRLADHLIANGVVVLPCRCEECACHTLEEPGMVYCPYAIGGWVSNEDFCSRAERKERFTDELFREVT